MHAHIRKSLWQIKCNLEYKTDEALCNYLLKLIKVSYRFE